MTEPLKIMDEIERESPVSVDKENTHRVAVCVDKWQSLRTALERQAEELAQKDARIAELKQDNLRLIRDGHAEATEAAELRARIARLQLDLSHLVEHIWTEEQAQEILNESSPKSRYDLPARNARTPDAQNRWETMCLVPTCANTNASREAGRATYPRHHLLAASLVCFAVAGVVLAMEIFG